MPGIPRVREAAWLVPTGTAPTDEHPTYLLLVRLEEEMDDPYAWTLELFQCRAPGRKAERRYAAEDEARTALDAVYKVGETMGTWRRWHRPSDAEQRAEESKCSRIN